MKNLTELNEETKNKILAKVSELLDVFDDYNDSIAEVNKETENIAETIEEWAYYTDSDVGTRWRVDLKELSDGMGTVLKKDYVKNSKKLFGELEEIIAEAEK